jgi:hypothetical protein
MQITRCGPDIPKCVFQVLKVNAHEGRQGAQNLDSRFLVQI